MSVAVVWFRRDLRLADNPALAAALKSHERIVPVYVDARDDEAPWQPGAASLPIPRRQRRQRPLPPPTPR